MCPYRGIRVPLVPFYYHSVSLILFTMMLEGEMRQKEEAWLRLF